MTDDTEEQLIERARLALSECNWTIGECASIWTQRYARGRSDQAFAELLGLSADQVYQRRRVWETFADVRESYAALSWSHFYTATSWDDAAECLQWADDMQATVAEMRAWRRAQRGEDLSSRESGDGSREQESELEAAAALSVEDSPRRHGGTEKQSEPVTMSQVMGSESVRSESENAESGGYAPFSSGARSVAQRSEPTGTRADADRLARTLALTLERCVAAIEKQPGVSDECSEELWDRVQRALATMQADWNSPARIH
jgi:hypothetical protein